MTKTVDKPKSDMKNVIIVFPMAFTNFLFSIKDIAKILNFSNFQEARKKFRYHKKICFRRFADCTKNQLFYKSFLDTRTAVGG